VTYLRGWLGYFGDCQTPSVLQRLDFGRWRGSNGNVDGRGFASFANGA
jgi:hypothetical protein